MSPKGHRLTAAAAGIGSSVGLMSAVHWDGISHLLAGGTAVLPALAVLFGVVLGARTPDWLEIAWFSSGGRESLIPHRTLTHWPWLWVAALTGVLVFARTQDSPQALFAAWVGIGFVAAALLHLVMDALTPMGIPFLTPFGPRYGVGLFATGKLGEGLALLPLMGILAGAGFMLARLYA